jgi:molybdate transport system permease protein
MITPGVQRPRTSHDVPNVVRPLAWVAGLFLGLPLAGLLLRAPWSSLFRLLSSTNALTALRLSLVTATIATALATVVGLPLALVIARSNGPLAGVVRNLVTVPLVLPPVVGGVALFLAFGRRGFLGRYLDEWFGITIPFTAAAVVLAELFVSMPFLVITVAGAMQLTPPGQLEAAATLGAGPGRILRTVTLPSIRPALISGVVLCWARAIGEFGATITFAGSFPGRTKTMPIVINEQLQQEPEAAVALSVVLLGVTVAVLVGLRQRWVGGLSALRSGL